MSAHERPRRLDWQRIRYQEGWDEIPKDHPEYGYLMADREKVSQLDDGQRKMRSEMIAKFALAEMIDKQHPIADKRAKGGVNWRNYDWNCFFRDCFGIRKRLRETGRWSIGVLGLKNIKGGKENG